jgi:drug/metabolite transporter (DMT)-like permease
MERHITRLAIPKTVLPYLALLTGVLCLSMSGIFIRWADAPSTVTSFYRMTFASLFLLPFFVKKQLSTRQSIKPWLFLAILGGIFTCMDHFTWSIGLNYTSVANATLLNYIAPLWVALVAGLVWKESLKGSFWLGLSFTLIGMAVIFGADLLNNPQVGKGDFFALISSFFYAAYFLVTQRARERVDAFRYIWIVVVIAAISLLLINVWLNQSLQGYSFQTIMVFMAAGLVSQCLGYFSVAYALGHLPAAVVSPTMILQPLVTALQPLVTALIAVPLAGEYLSPVQIVGVLTILGGIYLVNRR